MLRRKIAAIVNICTRHPWPVVALAALLTIFCSYYSARNFSINTDVNKLISPDLDWRKRELAVEAAFPHRLERILAVVEAPTSELATHATTELGRPQSSKKRAVD